MKKLAVIALALVACAQYVYAGRNVLGEVPVTTRQEFKRTGEKTKAGGKSIDWAALAFYEEKNEALIAEGVRPFAVLMGDSITWVWQENDKEFFKENKLIGRGISGQTTCEMLVRFRPDVIELHPKYAVIMGGTNDLAENIGGITIDNILRNLISMAELAKAAGIKPVLCSVPPADKFDWRPELGNRSDDIVRLNEMIKAYCKAHKYVFLDYHSAIKDADNALRKEYRNDSVHPNMKAYKVMESIFKKTLKK